MTLQNPQICNKCGAFYRSQANFCASCGQAAPNSLSSHSPTTMGRVRSSVNYGKLIGIVFIILLLVACNNINHANSPASPPISQPTIVGQITPSGGDTVPSSIAPDDICHAYDAWRFQDPYVTQRCQKAMQREQEIFAIGINESTYQTYRDYYAGEEASENTRARLANNICSEYIPLTDPNYTYDCNQAEDEIWRTGL